MTVRDALSRVKTVRLEALGTEPAQLPPVFETVARELAAAAGANVEVTETGDDVQEAGVFRIKAGHCGVPGRMATLSTSSSGPTAPRTWRPQLPASSTPSSRISCGIWQTGS